MAVILIALNIYVYCYVAAQCVASTFEIAYWWIGCADSLQLKGRYFLSGVCRLIGKLLELIICAFWLMPLMLSVWFLLDGCVSTVREKISSSGPPAKTKDIRELLSQSLASQDEQIRGHKKTAP